jgi:hypothetical protein
MTDHRSLALRLDQIIKQLEREKMPPYHEEPVNLSQGELGMILRALLVVDAISIALKP